MKVAILGSCVTRDAFEVRGHIFDDIVYCARTSWIAQAAPPPALEVEIGSDRLSEFGERMVREDLGRLVVERLIEARPNLVVIDLIDERFDLIDTGDGVWITESDYLSQTSMHEELTGFPRNALRSPDRLTLFAAAAPVIAERLTTGLPDVPFVLHAAFFTPIPTDDTTTFYTSAGENAVITNEALAACGRLIQQSLGDRVLTFTPRPEVMRADVGHRWGLSMYHYERDYYFDLLDALEAAASGRAHPLLSRGGLLSPPQHIIDIVEAAEIDRPRDVVSLPVAPVPAVPALAPTPVRRSRRLALYLPAGLRRRLRRLFGRTR